MKEALLSTKVAGEEPSTIEPSSIHLGVSRVNPVDINEKPVSIGSKSNTADYNVANLTITKTKKSSSIISSLKLFVVGNSSWIVNWKVWGSSNFDKVQIKM